MRNCNCSNCYFTSSIAMVIIAIAMKGPLQQLTLTSLAHGLHSDLNNKPKIELFSLSHQVPYSKWVYKYIFTFEKVTFVMYFHNTVGILQSADQLLHICIFIVCQPLQLTVALCLLAT